MFNRFTALKQAKLDLVKFYPLVARVSIRHPNFQNFENRYFYRIHPIRNGHIQKALSLRQGRDAGQGPLNRFQNLGRGPGLKAGKFGTRDCVRE